MLVAVASAIAMMGPPQQPTAANFDFWRVYLRPSENELAFEDCDWRPSLWEAATEARSTNKPILLWVMNGHPMACT